MDLQGKFSYALQELKDHDAYEGDDLRSRFVHGVNLIDQAAEKLDGGAKSASDEQQIGKEKPQVGVLRTHTVLAVNAGVLRDDLNNDEHRFGEWVLQGDRPGFLFAGCQLCADAVESRPVDGRTHLEPVQAATGYRVAFLVLPGQIFKILLPIRPIGTNILQHQEE